MFQEISVQGSIRVSSTPPYSTLGEITSVAYGGEGVSIWIPRGDMDYASEQEPESEEEEVDDNDNETTTNLQEMKIVSLKVIDCDCDCFGFKLFKLRTGCLGFGNALGRPLCT
jgi:hypothetical protein